MGMSKHILKVHVYGEENQWQIFNDEMMNQSHDRYVVSVTRCPKENKREWVQETKNNMCGVFFKTCYLFFLYYALTKGLSVLIGD